MISPLDFTPWPRELRQIYEELGYWSGEALGEILQKTAEKHGDNIALVDGGRTWTYKQLNNKANELAAGFIRLGIKPNNRVVVQLTNCGEFFEVLFALLRLHAQPVLTLPTHRYSEISFFCEFTEAVAYIAPDKVPGFDFRNLGRKLVKNKKVDKVIINGEAMEFHALSSFYDKPVKLSVPEGGSLALFQLSGGTTGIPKLIPRTHNDYFYSIRESAAICELNSDTVFLAPLPVSHNFLLSSPGALGVFYAGGTLVLANSGAPDLVFPLIEKHKVTITAAVPPLALTWINAVENMSLNNKPDLNSLQVLQVGGSKLSEEAARRVTPVLGCKLQQVFGMAEGLVNYTRYNDDLNTILTTQGRPISKHDEIKVVDEDDNPVPFGVAGNLLTRGPYTIRGYFRAPEHNLKAFTNEGFYRTGDIVTQTAAGYLIVEGRDKDQINRGGEKIAAEEIENHLLAHPKVFDAAVVAMPDDFLGERSCAFVIPQIITEWDEDPDKEPLKPMDLIKFMHQRELAAYKIPDRIELVTEFPKTKFGKVNKKALRICIANKLSLSTVS